MTTNSESSTTMKADLISKLGRCRIIGYGTLLVPYSLFLEVERFLEEAAEENKSKERLAFELKAICEEFREIRDHIPLFGMEDRYKKALQRLDNLRFDATTTTSKKEPPKRIWSEYPLKGKRKATSKKEGST